MGSGKSKMETEHESENSSGATSKSSSVKSHDSGSINNSQNTPEALKVSDSPLNNYTILEQIGNGMGTCSQIFKVENKKRSGEIMALKKIGLRTLSANEKQRIQKEADILKKLQHPNVVNYRDSFWENERTLCIEMTYCKHGDLQQILRTWLPAGQMWKELQIMEWFIQITLGVVYLHSEEVIHRDLKSANIFVTQHGLLKIGDMGASRLLELGNLASTRSGTPYYMSPEMIMDSQQHDSKTDIWSLGVLFYEMITLEFPFISETIDGLRYKIAVSTEWKYKIPESCSPAIPLLMTQLLEKEPENRPTAEKILKNEFIIKHMKELVRDCQQRPFLRSVELQDPRNSEEASNDPGTINNLNDTFQLHGIQQNSGVDPNRSYYQDSVQLAKTRIRKKSELESIAEELTGYIKNINIHNDGEN